MVETSKGCDHKFDTYEDEVNALIQNYELYTRSDFVGHIYAFE